MWCTVFLPAPGRGQGTHLCRNSSLPLLPKMPLKISQTLLNEIGTHRKFGRSGDVVILLCSCITHSRTQLGAHPPAIYKGKWRNNGRKTFGCITIRGHFLSSCFFSWKIDQDIYIARNWTGSIYREAKKRSPRWNHDPWPSQPRCRAAWTVFDKCWSLLLEGFDPCKGRWSVAALSLIHISEPTRPY